MLRYSWKLFEKSFHTFKNFQAKGQINSKFILSKTTRTWSLNLKNGFTSSCSRRSLLRPDVLTTLQKMQNNQLSFVIRLHARCEHEERSKSMFATQTWCGAKRNLAADSNFDLCCPYLNACVRAGVEKINAIIKLFPFSEKFLPSFFQKARRRRHASSSINPNL